MQSILIPIDFTQKSRSVLVNIGKLCSAESHHFILYHAYHQSKTDDFLISVEDIIENEILGKLEEEAKFFMAQLSASSPNIELKVDKGEFMPTLKKRIKRNGIDLIALGSDNGYSWQPGHSNTEEKTFDLVRQLDLPALVIPIGIRVKVPTEIVFATRHNSVHDAKELSPLVTLLQENKAHLDIISITKEEGSVKESEQNVINNINGYFKPFPNDIHVFSDHDPYIGILEFSRSHHADLLCILYKRPSFLEALLREQISKQMLSKVSLPLLILKYKH